MRELFIDIETFSPVNLAKSGVYPYADHDDFELLLFGYSIDGGPIEVIDLTNGHQLPETVLAALVDPHVGKWAFNASFERICLSTWLARHHPELMEGRRYLDPAQWHCTMVWSAYLSLPMSLEQVATVLDLPVRKDSAGKRLIRQFCTPAKPSVFDQSGMRNPPASGPDGWEQFISYNRRDVEVELAIHDRLADFPLPTSEWDSYALDQRVNDTGIRLDRVLVDHAVACDRRHRATTLARAQELTGLENPNSPIQLKDWLAAHGTPLQSLTKAEVAAALDTATGEVREVLQLRGELAKSSVKKYEAMQHVAGRDGRGRGFLQFYGAGRTRCFAGRLVQVQNLPRNYLPDLREARDLVWTGNFEALDLLYDSVPDTLSQLIRTAFIPADGYRFVVYICSPYSGDTENNVELARALCAHAVSQHKIPLAPHLLFPQFMDDNDASERELAMFFNRILLSKCEAIWVYTARVSAGMRAEIEWAHHLELPITYFDADFEEVTL